LGPLSFVILIFGRMRQMNGLLLPSAFRRAILTKRRHSNGGRGGCSRFLSNLGPALARRANLRTGFSVGHKRVECPLIDEPFLRHSAARKPPDPG
jgi:hypothetical protein